MAGCAENIEAWEILDQWTKPFLTAFSDGDPSTKPWEQIFQQRIPGAKMQSHATIEKAGHFLQEDQGERLAQTIIQFINNT